YLAQVKLFTCEDGNTFSAAPGEYWVEAAGPDCVLASARQHEIDIIPDTGYTEESYIGINYMKIGLDFKVATAKDAAAVAA
ncbi:MAG: hypothetical protein D3922_01190, partial [Candidatus Electrothrix sp. AR1]|nr:hypothetical protein [Candidatus Electrothrix sp. AR1]